MALIISNSNEMSVNLPIGQATESRGAETGTEVCRCKPKTACANRADRGQRQSALELIFASFERCEQGGAHITKPPF